ncbi:MAG: hypothetical protein AMJ93_09520 [Anaerolineae bacterium SM23_84]|nr:MAG: hypothetical protein AMJ93_09520 [Anaerolineae bacterium SM23_84]
MTEEELETLLATVTPERIRQLAQEIEAEQPRANRGTAPLFEVLAALTADLPIGAAAERSPVELRLRKAVIAAVEQIDSLMFVEGDG